MTSLGRNFDFRQSPIPQHRLGRFKTGTVALPQGAPVSAGATTDATDGRGTLALAVAGPPRVGRDGIVVWEEPWTNFHGLDPVLQLASDLIDVPAATPAQLVHGTEVRFVLTNTTAHSFEGQRNYAGRIMCVLAGVAVGDLLTPGTGDDVNGYWVETGTGANAWARVTYVDSTNGFLEAQLTF